ncbi:MAG: DUF4301 family protein [Bacteroidales bacterium]|nr:DUF4301 family protein [Bacteroidales bacterium]
MIKHFSDKDIEQIKAYGLSVDEVEDQIINFIKGFPYVKLHESVSKGNGLLDMSKAEIDNTIRYYEENKTKHSILKFVPSSGAATRMFKDLMEFSGLYMGMPYNMKNFPSAHKTLDNIESFAFYEELESIINASGITLEEHMVSGNYTTVVNYILTEIGLNYGKLPKALIAFHRYPEAEERKVRYAIEEHLVEGANYAREESSEVNIHFTVSPEHKEAVMELISKVQPHYEEVFGVKYLINYSLQKKETDTIAVNPDNTIAYDKDDKLIFRPSGHGALIENLNDIKGDIIFIKNIDNVAHDKLKPHTYKYKKLIAGTLIKVQEEVFSALRKLESGNLKSQDVVDIITLCNKIGINLSEEEKKSEDMMQVLFDKLNRPIRVCGVVKNQGEPGGGPFWVIKDGLRSLQIVESSQVNMLDEEQKTIFQTSQYFNPVDLVCGVKDYKSRNFDLRNFIDKDSGFISNKSKDGKLIKAQELPGLWNGAMANWITLFVEVPIQTFTPVKEVNDLLRDEHQY